MRFSGTISLREVCMFSLFKRKEVEFIDTDREARLERMEAKRQKCIEEMGDKWVLHPNHKQQKLAKPRIL